MGCSTQQMFRNWLFPEKPEKCPHCGRAVTHSEQGSVLAAWAPPPRNLPAPVPPTTILPT